MTTDTTEHSTDLKRLRVAARIAMHKSSDNPLIGFKNLMDEFENDDGIIFQIMFLCLGNNSTLDANSSTSIIVTDDKLTILRQRQCHEAMQRAGLTIRALALKAGVSTSSIGSFLRDKPMHASTKAAIWGALEKAGAVFVD